MAIEKEISFMRQDPITREYRPAKVTLRWEPPAAYRHVPCGAEVDDWVQYMHVPVTNVTNPFVRAIQMPKFAPYVTVDGIDIKVAGWRVGCLLKYQINHWKIAARNIKEIIGRTYSDYLFNGDRDNHTKDPVPRNLHREGWVEEAMWRAKMPRSNYRPTSKDRSAYVNVGTIGHIDHGR